ncbi:MAG TPA: LysR family transcriptional regulator [Phenylobacterium sp.]|jgi:DNA-binding transcriptional LysR family regulator|nr:LysR family transcriptional regulator [Phenylobacterium sp.]
MNDEISDLRLFVRIVAAGSLSETARRLNSSPPAMSRRLSAMEHRLGARLIDRSTRRFSLTEEGALLYERGTLILADIDQVEAEVGASTRAPRGHIRVGAPLEIGRRRIAPLVGDFIRKHPGVTVELVLSDSRANIVGDELDLALHTDQPLDGDIITRLVLPSHRAVCASPDYIARRGRPEAPADLLQHDCIQLVRGHQVLDRWTFVDNGKPLEVRTPRTLSTNSAEVIHDWILAGHGLGLKALWDVEGDLAAGRLVELLAPYRSSEINLYVIYRTRTHLPNRVRLFIDFVVDGLTK